MQICRFTKPELDFLRENCNFVNREIEVFEQRAKGVPLEEIAENINVSVDAVRKTSQQINKKIKRVL